MTYNTATLSNGLRIIHRPSKAQVVYCGYQINAGTRDEKPGEEGLAHFCEHATFKGTARRKAWHVINSLENVGGDLNAYTNKEGTVYHASLLREHMPRAIDLLTDIVFHSVYPQSEIEKEVEVICDEIESYNDSPAELIYDEFESLLFDGHPLGHNILGTSENVRNFTSEDARRFTGRHYRPDNSIFFIDGDVDFDHVVCLLCKAHGARRTTATTADKPSKNSEETSKKPHFIEPTVQGGSVITRIRNTHQAHVMVGTQAYSIHHPRRMALYLLNNILGGPGMNARLNISLRERKGLVYTVESSMVSYGDTGAWCIYYGCDPHNIQRCHRLARRELTKLMDHPLTERQLSAAKKQIKGQIGVACDNRESFALDFGKSFLHYGWEKDLDNLYRHIDQLTADDLLLTAREVFDSSRLITLVYK